MTPATLRRGLRCLILGSCITLAAPAVATAACDASAGADWKAAGPGIRILARTLGPDCTEAVAVFVIRDGSGRLLYQTIFATKGVFLLADAKDAPAMAKALDEWVTPGRGLNRTSQLPEWPEGAERPVPQEFPFYPEWEDDPQFYRQKRAADLPMFCFVQGMESARCIAAENGVIEDLGVQSFPG